MKTWQKILIGGLGALTPVVLNLLVVDLENLLPKLTGITFLGYAFRVLILFYIGAMVAYLHKSENEPFKVFELGVVAPALLTAMLNGYNMRAGLPTKESLQDSARAVAEENFDEDAADADRAEGRGGGASPRPRRLKPLVDRLERARAPEREVSPADAARGGVTTGIVDTRGLASAVERMGSGIPAAVSDSTGAARGMEPISLSEEPAAQQLLRGLLGSRKGE